MKMQKKLVQLIQLKLKMEALQTQLYWVLTSIDGFDFKRATILGSGGASKAVAFALKSRKIPYVIFSRKSDPKFLNYSDQEKYIPNSDLIINTTPLGTFPNTNDLPPINFELISNKSFCYDLL